jgi:5'-methylthioinosine phosphorylase
MKRIAIIGGSGLTRLENLKVLRREVARTPYGEPSAPLVFGTLSGQEVVFLARHGQTHRIPPHMVNYRANLWALHSHAEADVVIAVAAVGAIRRDLEPSGLVVPDQIIDYTHCRQHTYFDATSAGRVTHIDFTFPYCEPLRRALLRGAADAGMSVSDGGVYGATQGPRFETAAEIGRMERDGVDVVGMTGMPETALARELGICYATLAVVVNPAAGRGNGSIDLRDLDRALSTGIGRARRVLEATVALLAAEGLDIPAVGSMTT